MTIKEMLSTEPVSQACKFTHCIQNQVNKFQTAEMRKLVIGVLLTLSTLVSVSLPMAVVPQSSEAQPPPSCQSTGYDAVGHKTFMHICEMEENTIGELVYMACMQLRIIIQWKALLLLIIPHIIV